MKTTAQERRALEQRSANAEAKATGKPMPYANPWDTLSPVPKLAANATRRDRVRWALALADASAPKK